MRAFVVFRSFEGQARAMKTFSHHDFCQKLFRKSGNYTEIKKERLNVSKPFDPELINW